MKQSNSEQLLENFNVLICGTQEWLQLLQIFMDSQETIS